MKSCILWFKGFVLLPFLVLGLAAACSVFQPPQDGILSCVPTSSGKVCSPACKASFDFAASPALFYICQNSQWSFVALPPANLSVSSPDCKRGIFPSRIKSSGLTKYFYNGDASKSSVQTEIKETFKALLSDVYGRSEFCQTNPQCTNSNIEIFYNDVTVHCQSYDKPVGIADGILANSSFTASSYYPVYPPWNARLRGSGETAWYALPWDLKPWIQVDLSTAVTVAGIATQGKRFVNYIKTYKLAFSGDGNAWKMYAEDDKEKVFQGNKNPYSVVTNWISPRMARFVRLHAITWQSGAALRMEIYKCKMFI